MQPVEKLKICLIIPNKFSVIGGYENFVRALASELSSCSTVQVVCPCTVNERKAEKKIQIYPILKTSTNRPGSLLHLLPNLLFTYNYLRKERPHVVNAHPSYPSGLFALPAKLLGIPIVGTAHGGDVLINTQLEYGNRRNLITAKLTKFTLAKINLLTVVSKSLIPDAISAGADPSKIRVIYNGIDPKRNQIESDKDILERFHIANSDFVVLYFGRLMLTKRPADLVKAFSLVLKSISNARLVIAGQGPEEANLKRLAIELDLEDRTTFAGFVSELDKDALFARCDVFVLPSEVDVCPISIIEAMAYQKPVIASNIGAFLEILQDHKTGVIVPVGVVDKLASAIIKVHSDESTAIEMGKQARAEVEKRFNISKTARDYLEVYREAIDNT